MITLYEESISELETDISLIWNDVIQRHGPGTTSIDHDLELKIGRLIEDIAHGRITPEQEQPRVMEALNSLPDDAEGDLLRMLQRASRIQRQRLEEIQKEQRKRNASEAAREIREQLMAAKMTRQKESSLAKRVATVNRLRVHLQILAAVLALVLCMNFFMDAYLAPLYLLVMWACLGGMAFLGARIIRLMKI